MQGISFFGVSLSPNGKYVLVKYYTRLEGGKSESYAQLREAASGRILLQDKGFIMSASWMPDIINICTVMSECQLFV